jgi:hypothetical protein
VVLDSGGKWENERKPVVIRGISALNSINICVARAPNIEVRVLEQLYNSLVESNMITGRNLGVGRWMEGNRESI